MIDVINTRPLPERMQVEAIIDNIIFEHKENGQIVTTGENPEVLAPNYLHHPRPLGADLRRPGAIL